MMTPNQLIDAMGDLPDEMIAEAHDETLAHRKRSIWTRWAALAACACLIIGAVAVPILRGRYYPAFHPQTEETQNDAEADSAPEEAEEEADLATDITADTVPEEAADLATDITADSAPEESEGIAFPASIDIPPESLWATILEGNGVLKAFNDVRPLTVKAQTAEEFYTGDEYSKWWGEYRQKREDSAAVQENMDEWYAAILPKLLGEEKEGTGDANAVCSPLNLYFALSMLAEITDGATQEQILTALGVSDADALRTRFTALWEANAVDTPILQSHLANSLWLNQDIAYNDETLQNLTGLYHATSVVGEMGSDGMNQALRDWTNTNTGGLLKEAVDGMELKEDTVIKLVSALYYHAAWSEAFLEENTDRQLFYGTAGDTEVDMMHQTQSGSLFAGETWTAVSLHLTDSGNMFFFLPEEGTPPSQIFSDPAILDLAQGRSWEDGTWADIHLSIPKFTVSEQQDLLDTLDQLGMTDLQVAGIADFTPLTEDPERAANVYLSEANHAAMLEIDEEGVTGAAYTEFAAADGAALPTDEIDFVLDRPFAFLVTGADGSILFAGVINNIE